MNIRDTRQKEFSDIFLQMKSNGILYLCPRFGKCRVGINILKAVDNPKVLIAYPEENIKNSWIKDFNETNFDYSNVSFTTFRSLHKQMEEVYDLIIVDEIHLLSDAQIEVLRCIIKKGIRVLGLTGTMSNWTKTLLKRMLGMQVLASYSIFQAIEEGIIPDYSITIKIVPLDKKDKFLFGKKTKTEKAHFDAYSWAIDKTMENNKDTMFLRLARMRLLQKSVAKLKETKKLIQTFINERLLVFSGLIDIADSLGITSYHSKKKEKSIFSDFMEGKIPHLAVVDIGAVGSTYKPLSKVIINYFDSNPENLAQKIFRCMSMEYNNPNKKADIWIISSNEKVELDWLKKSLEFFDEKKIIYI